MKVGSDAMHAAATVSMNRNDLSNAGEVLRAAAAKKLLRSDVRMTEKPVLVAAKTRPLTSETASRLVCCLDSATRSGSERRTVTSLAIWRSTRCLASASDASVSE